MSDLTKDITVKDVVTEFNHATDGIDFSGKDGNELRQVFYNYFVAGIVFAHRKLTETDISLSTGDINETKLN